jgi:hypothetical protein
MGPNIDPKRRKTNYHPTLPNIREEGTSRFIVTYHVLPQLVSDGFGPKLQCVWLQTVDVVQADVGRCFPSVDT